MTSAKDAGGTARHGLAGRHGGQVLVDQLKAHGVRRVFSVPGESFLAVLDALYDSGIENIVCRHEGAAAMMAEATGKLTGRPGVAFVTRGPGAMNASSGVHVARQDSTPMVLFVGQIARGHRDREAFQELDYRAVFGSVAKWVAEVDDADRLVEYINRAFLVACTGRPGPVVLALPEDMLSGLTGVVGRAAHRISPTAVSQGQVDDIQRLLMQAKRPLVVAGGSGWTAAAALDLQRFAQAFDVPVAVTFRRQDYLDNRVDNYVGDLGVGMNAKLGKRLKDSDFLLVLGARFGDITTGGYTLVTPQDQGRVMVHVHPDPNLPGQLLNCDLTVSAHPVKLLEKLAELRPEAAPVWAEWRRAARADYENWQVPVETPGAVKMEAVVGWLSQHLPHDAIL
ncbi:MAG: thiamine pyrophosphate-binding protein, partial [Paracoccaceae bacterium]